MTTRITIPDLSLVALVGVSGSGKSTFAARHFAPTRDPLVGLLPRPGRGRRERPVGDRRRRSTVLHFIAEKRLEAGRLTVVDATNVQPRVRSPLVELARQQHVLPVAIVLDVPPERLPRAQRAAPRPALRPPRRPQPAQRSSGARSAACSAKGSGTSSSCARRRRSRTRDVEREPLLERPARRARAVRHHRRRPRLPRRARGAADRARLRPSRPTARTHAIPTAARAVFLGDLVDRGPQIPAVLRLAMQHGRRRRRDLRSGQPRRTSCCARSTAATCRSPTASPSPSPSSSAEPPEFRAARSRPSSTAWSATTCSTTASSSSRTPG